MSTSNGFTAAMDWEAAFHTAAALDFANDQRRFPGDERTPCANPHCDQLSVSIYCGERCRQEVEGLGDEDPEELGHAAAAEFSPTCAPLPALPEAPVSLNTFVTMAGRQVQVTLRGSDLPAVLSQMEALLQRYPVAQAVATPQPPAGKAWCQIHSAQMKEQHGKDGRTWYSHKTADGWCKGVKRG